ncbi:unnamed protein product [Rotaria sp. Silwood1]|nr:unnamed protein product [Rotaria sp. Silwood1]CAF1068169.1 unnamed protein product [Rotaria sp. Silwood1]CAF3436400.1 unnamed protein product [Rotaria sp. Silwood1]CAF4624850.1 unnamed protein product [Rotaria sp. Silwood1]
MSSARVSHQRASVRPTLSSYRTVPRTPPNPRSVTAPRFLPILQPPQLPKRVDLINENKKEQKKQKKTRDHQSALNNDQNRKVTELKTIGGPILNFPQRYPYQPLAHQSTQLIRYVEPKHAYVYYIW